MADKLQITIVGLGLIGASAGLALRRYQEKVYVVGHDKNSSLAGKAKRLGAVDRTEWNLITAVANADRVLLALPINEVHDTLSAIAQDLKPGCVLIDTADVKAPVLSWAAELLPKEVHMVGGHPIVLSHQTEPDEATADLFQNKLFCLTPDARTDTTAVRLAADLAEALGAKSFFMDPTEHDGMIAAVEHLPQLLAGALMAVTGNSSGWRDMRKLAASQFYSSTLIMPENGQAAASACLANREHALHWLDALIAELDTWRQRLSGQDEQALAGPFDGGLELRADWLRAQITGNWGEEDIAQNIPTAGTMMRDLLGFGPRRTQPVEKPKR
jgi:prephenate dehydrogenase